MQINFAPQNFLQHQRSTKTGAQTRFSLNQDSVSFCGTVDISDGKKEGYSIPFLHGRTIKAQDKLAMLAANEAIITDVELAKRLGVNNESVLNWLKAGKLLYDKADIRCGGIHDRNTYIDTAEAQNTEFIEYLQGKLPDAIPAGNLRTMCNISQNEVSEAYEKLTQIGTNFDRQKFTPAYAFSVLIDRTDEKFAKFVEETHRTRPFQSKYYKKPRTDGRHIPHPTPVRELSELGFGNASDLARMVVKGELPGNYETKTKDGKRVITNATIDIEPYSCQRALMELREKNENVVDIKKFAQRFGVGQAQVRQWLREGELKLIPEFIFEDDAKRVFIDIQKNEEFVEQIKAEAEAQKLLQEKLRAERAVQRAENRSVQDKESSLRMKIAWALIPDVKQVMKDGASLDRFVGLILAKQDNDENLSSYEQVHVAKYRKGIWSLPNTKERLSYAVNAAVSIMEQFKMEGITSIDDPEIAKIIEMHYALDAEGND